MDKKAASILMMIFEILVVLLAGYIVISAAQAFGKSETVQKINAAEEIKMMVDTLVGVPGDALVEFPYNAPSFNFILTANEIHVFLPEEAENVWASRRFYPPQGYTAEGVLEGEEKLCLEKKSRKILLRKCP